MVILNYGEPTWDTIKEKANVTQEMFVSNESYPDSMTYDLVAAASEILAIEPNVILEAFGKHWILNTAMEGYGGLMKASGKDIKDFLCNLPNFHTRINMVFPDLKPPVFKVSNVQSNSLNLHYSTFRPGLQHFVIGLLQGIAAMFDTPAEVAHIHQKTSDEDADVFHIKWHDKHDV